MTASIFELLNSIGIHYPIHPVFAHIPMGMLIGGFLLTLVAFFFKKQQLFRSAYHCSVVALAGVPVAAIAGFMDWQQGFAGEWLTPVKIKMAMTVVLTILLITLVVFGKNWENSPTKFVFLYGLTLLSTMTIGYWGGHLVFG
jgi:uncharacterized membrane protein